MRRLLVLVALVLTSSACTSEPADDDGTEASQRTIACPPEVEVAILIPHSCGELVVPEDRSHSHGPSIRLRYVRVLPDEETAGEVPLLSIGYELAQPPDFGDSVGITQSTHRELVIFSQRGSGLSEPRLDCPEAEIAGLLEPPAAAAAERFGGAVATCRERLTRDGIDPAAYTLRAAAQDIADLRATLGISAWDLVSWGSASRILVEYAALEPGAVHAMSLDSPELPGADPVAGAAGDLTRALEALEVGCSTAPGCAAPGTTVTKAMQRAARRLEAHPAIATVDGRRVVVGGAALVRVIRERLASEPRQAPSVIPRLVRSAVRGHLQPVARLLMSRPGPCLGYLPLCDAPVSLGAYLSLACQVPDMIPPAPAYPGYGEEHPFRVACRAWGVARSSAAEPPEVPTLVLWGELDPFVPAGIVDLTQEDLDEPHVVLVPGVGHDTVSGLHCIRAVRNAWFLHSDRPPNYLDCLRSMAPVSSR